VSILLEHVTVEEVALQRVVGLSEILNPFNPKWRLLVHRVLSLSIGRAKIGIVGPWEEIVANACAGVVMCIGSIAWAVLRWLPARAFSRSGGVSLLESV
jgi:hypothetical protein